MALPSVLDYVVGGSMSALAVASTEVFEVSSVPSPGGSTEFSLYLNNPDWKEWAKELAEWESHRNSGIAPRFHSGFSDDIDRRVDFLVGAALYGLRGFGRFGDKDTIKPQQLAIVDTLNCDFDTFAVEIPRRASKTTTIFCLLLGRMMRRPGYQVTFSAQSGVAGSRRLREWKTRLDLINPPDDDGNPFRQRARRPPQALALFGGDHLAAAPKSRGFRILSGEVGKGIYCDNGSQMLVLKPEAGAVRGEAADAAWIDEGQEVDPDEGEELMAGLLPLLDTKPGASIIISGTAGEARVGPFWERLALLRAKNPDVGGIDYAADPLTPWELIESEEDAMRLIETTHPGIGTLTTMEKMRKNWHGLAKPKWAREYLSLWPEVAGVRAIPDEYWTKGELKRRPPIPARVAFGMSIKPGGSVTAIVAAWRDGRGRAYVEVVEHRSGTAWAPRRMQELTSTYRGSTIAFDDIAEGKATATETLVLSPRPRLRVQTYRERAAGCVQIMRDLERGSLKHFPQNGLDQAVELATRREVRGESGVWLWMVRDSKDDITCLDAATAALRNWDQHFARANTAPATPIMGD